MHFIGSAALWTLTSLWVLQAAAALVKTRKARRLFIDHQRWIDSGITVQEKRRVALIIAVKGASGNFPRYLDFVLNQDYPDYRVIFTVESASDPAYATIRNRIGGVQRASLIVAGKATRSGQKVHNQLAAFRELRPTDAVIAFADADFHSRRNWLSCLVLPLNLGQADCTTGHRWFIPADRRLPNRIAALIGTAMEPWIGPAWRMCLWGGSMALTREAFDGLEIPKNLDGSINDDVRISHLARRAGKRMRYVRSVVGLTQIDFTWASLFEFGRRQYFQLRVGHLSLWWMGLLTQLIYIAGFATCIIRLSRGNLVVLVPLAIVILLNLARTRIRRSYLRARFPNGEADTLDAAVRGSGWLDPLMNLVHLLIILSAACSREIVWAGIRYRVTGQQSTEVL